MSVPYQLGFFGDSIGYGTYLGYATSVGGLGSFMELVAESIADVPGIGPLMSPGFQTVANTTDWSYTGAWPATVATDAHDVFPRYGVVSAGGATAIAKYTVPTAWRSPRVGLVVSICDYASSGNVRYRLDGGSWTNLGVVLAHDNKIFDIYIAGAFTTFEIQAYDGASSAGVCLGGVTPYFVDPTAANSTGFVLQNYAFNGMLLDDLFASTNGDRMAIVGDGKVKYSGGAPSRVCNLGNIGMFGANDVAGINNTTTWATDLTAFVNRLSPLGAVAWISEYETASTTTDQAAYRAKTNAVIPPLGAYLFDLFTAWQLDGFGAQGSQTTGAQTAGLLQDFTHPTQRGHLDLWPRVLGFLRHTLLARFFGPNVNAYAVGSSGLGGTAGFGGVSTVLLSSADTASGADANSIAAALADADTGTSSDAGESIAAAVADTETSTGTDAGESIAATTSDTETCSAVDGEAITVSIVDSDTGTTADGSEAIVAAASDDEPSAATDAGETVAATMSDTDAGSTADAGEQLAVTDNDSSSATDDGETVAVAVTDDDPATATDAGEQLAVADGDSSTGTDAENALAVALADTELSTAVDAGENVTATLTDDDTGTAVDSGAIAPLAISDGDTSTGTDAGEAIEVTATDADVSSATDAGTLNATLTEPDTATGSDSETIVVAVSDGDTAVVIEAELILAAAVADLETGTAVDAGSVVVDSGTVVNKSDGDTVTATEAAFVSLLRDLAWAFGAPTGARWTFDAPSARWTFEAGAEAWTLEGADQ